MSTVFWVATIVMAVLAFSFIAAPLQKAKRRLGIAGIAAVLPLFATGLYLLVGSPQAAGVNAHLATPAKLAPASAKKSSVDSVAKMVGGLAARLEENPDDGKSWLLLARSYKHLNRNNDAVEAYGHAAALGQHDAELAALAATDTAHTTPAAQIFGNLQLSERAQEVVLPTDTVFVFARAVDGPAMPVAVLQRSVSDLPLDFLLNDSQAIAADAKLSNHEQVVVTARVSRSGVATDALKGLEAKSHVIGVAENRHVNLIIE